MRLLWGCMVIGEKSCLVNFFKHHRIKKRTTKLRTVFNTMNTTKHTLSKNYYKTKMEIWKDIKDYEGLYQVSNMGRVKSLYRRQGKRTVSENIMNTTINNDGYTRVVLSKAGKLKTFCIHRLVAEHFVLNEKNKATVNHKDGNKSDNTCDNLEWFTQQEQIQHAIKIGVHKGRPKTMKSIF